MSKRPSRPGRAARALLLASLVAAASACSPSLDWRQLAPVGSGATLSFPCRPDVAERAVRIADTDLRMHMHSCKADDRWFSLAFVDAPGGSAAAPLLAALRRSAADNVAGRVTVQAMPAIAGATPSAQSARLRIVGKLPDGRPVVETAVFFVRGVRLYQASVIGDAEATTEVLDTFFASIRVT